MPTATTFFSYSRVDSAFALKLAKDLREAGANVWLDQLDIPPGSRWDESVQHALKTSDLLLVILSPSSVASENVMDEVSYALGEGKKVIPILLSDCDTPFRIKRLQRIDFTGDYHTGLNQLIKILRPADGGNMARSDVSPVIVNKPRPGSIKKSKAKKYLLLGAGAVLIILLSWWAINSGSAKSDDQKNWMEALQKNDSSSYALYLKEFPNGAYHHQAKEKLDSIYAKKEKLDSIHNKEISDSLVAKNEKTKPNESTTTQTTQKKPIVVPVINTTTKIECQIWNSNLTIINTHIINLGEGGKSFTNRAALKQIVSNIDLHTDANLNKMKTQLLSLITNAPSNADPNYDMEFTQEAKLNMSQLKIDIQKHVDKCN